MAEFGPIYAFKQSNCSISLLVWKCEQSYTFPISWLFWHSFPKGRKNLIKFPLAQKKAETSAAAARGRLAAQPGEAAAHGRGSLQRGPWGGHQPTRPFVGRGEATLGYLRWGEGKSGARVPGARWPQEKRRSAEAEMLSEVFKRKKENPVLALGKYSCFGTEGDWERRAVRSPLLPPGRSRRCFRWRWGESHGGRPAVVVPKQHVPSQQSWQEAASRCAERPQVSEGSAGAGQAPEEASQGQAQGKASQAAIFFPPQRSPGSRGEAGGGQRERELPGDREA